MAKEDTPPSSTRASIEDMIEEDDADINEDNAHEVIELGDLDDLPNGENGLENEDEGDDYYELEASEEGSMIVQDVKDNSAFVFKEHTSE